MDWSKVRTRWSGNSSYNIFEFFWFVAFLHILASLILLGPCQANINAIEEKFPDFLRDMAEYWKGGLSMTVAVQTLAGSEYGALNNEVKKMSDQLSWGVAFSDVIGMFAERVGTPIVKRAISYFRGQQSRWENF